MGNAALLSNPTTTAFAAAGGYVEWNTESFNDSGFFSTSDPTKLTVPSGVSRVRLNANIALGACDDGANLFAQIHKNGLPDWDGKPSQTAFKSSTSPVMPRASLASPVVEVEEGDYFQVHIRALNDSDFALQDNGSNFGIEASN